mmetsp:Transcript_24347/g.65365  ORF Transcript_24347/g.65365 Transcript_24347/m.65365 type:complete len:317 (-) Transcript_24347:1117-2067(-)
MAALQADECAATWPCSLPPFPCPEACPGCCSFFVWEPAPTLPAGAARPGGSTRRHARPYRSNVPSFHTLEHRHRACVLGVCLDGSSRRMGAGSCCRIRVGSDVPGLAEAAPAAKSASNFASSRSPTLETSRSCACMKSSRSSTCKKPSATFRSSDGTGSSPAATSTRCSAVRQEEGASCCALSNCACTSFMGSQSNNRFDSSVRAGSSESGTCWRFPVGVCSPLERRGRSAPRPVWYGVSASSDTTSSTPVTDIIFSRRTATTTLISTMPLSMRKLTKNIELTIGPAVGAFVSRPRMRGRATTSDHDSPVSTCHNV